MRTLSRDAIPDSHYVYTLLCQDGDGPGYVKFGKSSSLMARVSSIQASCPIPIHYMGFIHVQSKKQQDYLEQALLMAFADRQITGEWFRFDFSSKEDKEEFNETCRALLGLHVGKGEYWKKLDVVEWRYQSRERMKQKREKSIKRLELRKDRKTW